jgi:hypothetical protein
VFSYFPYRNSTFAQTKFRVGISTYRAEPPYPESEQQHNAQALSARPRHRCPVRNRLACAARQRAGACVPAGMPLPRVCGSTACTAARTTPAWPSRRREAGVEGADDAAGRSRCGASVQGRSHALLTCANRMWMGAAGRGHAPCALPPFPSAPDSRVCVRGATCVCVWPCARALGTCGRGSARPARGLFPGPSPPALPAPSAPVSFKPSWRTHFLENTFYGAYPKP